MEQVLRIALENARWDPEAGREWAKSQGLPDLPPDMYIEYAAAEARTQWESVVRQFDLDDLPNRLSEASAMMGDHEKNLTDEARVEVVQEARRRNRQSRPNRFMGLSESD